MFTGNYKREIDNKGRVSVPVQFRRQMNSLAFAIHETIFDAHPAYEVIKEIKDNLSEEFMRYAAHENTFPLEFEANGRITAPKPFRERLGISDKGGNLQFFGLHWSFGICNSVHWHDIQRHLQYQKKRVLGLQNDHPK